MPYDGIAAAMPIAASNFETHFQMAYSIMIRRSSRSRLHRRHAAAIALLGRLKLFHFRGEARLAAITSRRQNRVIDFITIIS